MVNIKDDTLDEIIVRLKRKQPALKYLLQKTTLKRIIKQIFDIVEEL